MFATPVNHINSLPTCQQLVEEHRFILSMLDELERLSFRVDQIEPSILMPMIRQVIHFITEFVDGYHHAKEEDVLFKMLATPGVLTHCNPIGQMMFEHNMGREHVALLIEGLDTEDLSKIREGLADYVQLLRQHIFKEDNVLYPMAERSLLPEQKDAVLAGLDKIEQQVDKSKLWSKYQLLQQQLQVFASRPTQDFG